MFYNLCDGADIKAKHTGLYVRYIALFGTLYVLRENVKNNLFTSYCSHLYLSSVWAKFRKSSMQHFIVS